MNSMQKLKIIIIRPVIIALLSFIAISCNKISHNGNLDGMWRIITIENLENGDIYTPDQHFYCFNLHTANLTGGNEVPTANMTYKYPVLYLDFPYESPGNLVDWGIYSNYVKFDILQLTKSDLVMQSEDVLITLKKF